MDGRTDPLNDAALEHEIEALLAAEPSSDFLARVRSRVAEESMSGGRGWRWPVAAVAATVAVAVVGIGLWQPAQQPVPPAARMTASVKDSVPPPGADLEAHSVPRQAVSVVTPRRSIDIALPAVMIAESESRAFAMLVRTAPKTQFDFASATPAMTPVEVDEIPRMQPVALNPIEIEPLVKAVELE
jgi:hypothetical protein